MHQVGQNERCFLIKETCVVRKNFPSVQYYAYFCSKFRVYHYKSLKKHREYE